jgi:hypothetical protein
VTQQARTLEAHHEAGGDEVDLGSGLELVWAVREAPTGEALIIGCVLYHPSAGRLEGGTPKGERCGMDVLFDVDAAQSRRYHPSAQDAHPWQTRPVYALAAWHPLTIKGTLTCPGCGLTGEIGAGRWHAAQS